MEIRCSECHKVLEVYDWEAILYKLNTKEMTNFICMPPHVCNPDDIRRIDRLNRE